MELEYYVRRAGKLSWLCIARSSVDVTFVRIVTYKLSTSKQHANMSW